MNKELKSDFKQVCVWPACVVGETEDDHNKFEGFMYENFKVRVQYLEEIKTKPDVNQSNGTPVSGTGGRNDLFFAIHNDDVGKFAVARLQYGIRWIEDVLAECNYSSPIYPERVFKYKCWEA